MYDRLNFISPLGNSNNQTYDYYHNPYYQMNNQNDPNRYFIIFISFVCSVIFTIVITCSVYLCINKCKKKRIISSKIISHVNIDNVNNNNKEITEV